MTKGIRVFWPGDGKGSVDEIEYFEGIDVNDLQTTPKFKTVPVFWPEYLDGLWVEYVVQTEFNSRPRGEVCFAVTYSEADNAALVEEHGDKVEFHWGTNTIILKSGGQSGRCVWRPRETVEAKNARWEAFDVCAPRAKPLSVEERAKRDARFRAAILARDKMCVLTEETTRAVLQAAHLVPAKRGRNDVPSNGVALRADLHALFDAGLFTFGRNGVVKIPRSASELSREYRDCLLGRRLPPSAYESVKATLALPEFVNR